MSEAQARMYVRGSARRSRACSLISFSRQICGHTKTTRCSCRLSSNSGQVIPRMASFRWSFPAIPGAGSELAAQQDAAAVTHLGFVSRDELSLVYRKRKRWSLYRYARDLACRCSRPSASNVLCFAVTRPAYQKLREMLRSFSSRTMQMRSRGRWRQSSATKASRLAG